MSKIKSNSKLTMVEKATWHVWETVSDLCKRGEWHNPGTLGWFALRMEECGHCDGDALKELARLLMDAGYRGAAPMPDAPDGLMVAEYDFRWLFGPAMYPRNVNSTWCKFAERIQAEKPYFEVGSSWDKWGCRSGEEPSHVPERLGMIRALLHEGIETEVKDELMHPFHLEYALEEVERLLKDLYAAAWRKEGEPLMLPLEGGDEDEDIDDIIKWPMVPVGDGR